MCGDHPNYYIIEIGQNTEKSTGDFRRLVVIQIRGRNYQPTLVRKTLIKIMIIINMHDPESFLENEMHKFLWDFEIHMDRLITARQPDLIIINKKKRKKKERTCRIMGLAVLANH